MTLDSGSLAASAAKINDNAIELAEKVKKSVESLVSSVQIVVQNAVTEIGKKMDELIETVKTNTAETRKMRKELKANSWLLGELVKDSRLTTMRKDEIITGYKKMIENEEEEENEKHDET